MRRKKIFTIILIIGLVIVISVGYSRLTVKNIQCQSQFGPCDDEIVSALEVYKDKVLLHSYSGLRQELNNHSKVADYSVNFLDPATIQAKVVQRRPQVAVIAEGSGEYHLYSFEGYLLEKATETQLPVVRIKDISVITDDQMKFVIEMAYTLNQTYNVNSVLIQEGGMEFEMANAPKIIFPVQGDIDVLLGSLTFVLSQLNSQLGDFRMESVDFRFKNPVIRQNE